jgi:hypothetical protein
MAIAMAHDKRAARERRVIGYYFILVAVEGIEPPTRGL